MFVLVVYTGRTQRTVVGQNHHLVEIINNCLEASRIDVQEDASTAVALQHLITAPIEQCLQPGSFYLSQGGLLGNYDFSLQH